MQTVCGILMRTCRQRGLSRLKLLPGQHGCPSGLKVTQPGISSQGPVTGHA